MAKDAIRAKLLPKLTQVIRNESQLVYIMSKLRKLLEQQSNSQPTFSTVNFYCNWVLHTKLDISAVADDIVRVLDDLHKAANKVTAASFPNAHLLGFSKLRQELKACLTYFGLPTLICDSNPRFQGFLRNLGKAIEDTPLYIHRQKAAQKTAYVESVIVQAGKDTRNRPTFLWKVAFHTTPSKTIAINMTSSPKL